MELHPELDHFLSPALICGTVTLDAAHFENFIPGSFFHSISSCKLGTFNPILTAARPS
jgi:hypothetical protein